jgi:hypothetical protein
MKENSRLKSFLASIPTVSIEDPKNDLVSRSKFNFSYFSKVDQAGQDFKDWSHDELIDLCEKLTHFSREPLSHWQKTKAGGGKGHFMEVYKVYPAKSKFPLPSHVPHQALWARFRLDRGTRLVGFILPIGYDRKSHNCGTFYDCNTFYVVFLDRDHEFYPM